VKKRIIKTALSTFILTGLILSSPVLAQQEIMLSDELLREDMGIPAQFLEGGITTDMAMTAGDCGTDTLQDHFDGPDTSYWGYSGANTVKMVAETFQANSSYDLNSVVVPLEKGTGSTGNVYVKIYSQSGGLPTGSALATSNPIDSSTFDATGYRNETFTFSTPFAIAGGTTYALVIDATSATAVIYSPYGTDYSGTGSYYIPTSWSDQSPADLLFQTCSVTEGGGEPPAADNSATSTPEQVQTNLFHGIFLFIISFGGIVWILKQHS